MIYLTEIDDNAKQELQLAIEDGSIVTLSLRYEPTLYTWFMSVTHNGITISERRLYQNPNMLRQFYKIFPFGIGCSVIDGLDPFFIDDFKTGRAQLMLLTQQEVLNYEKGLKALKDASL